MVAGQKMQVAVLLEAHRFDGPVRNLMYGLDALADEVQPVYVAIARRGEVADVLLRAMSERNIPVEIIRERFRFDPWVAVRLRRVLQRRRPDVIQVHNAKSRLFVVALGLVSRYAEARRRVFFFHGETWTTFTQRIYNAIDRRLFSHAPIVVAVTETQVDVLRKWGTPPERIQVVANAIPQAPARSSTGVDRSLIVTAGRMSREKGHSLLIEALASIKQLPGVSPPKLTIYGEGPERAALESLANSLNLHDRVQYAGYVSNLECAYSNAGVFVLPSLSEGLPNVLLEAAARAVPIIATRVGGIPDLLVDGVHARLVEPGSPAALRTAIEEYLASPEEFARMAQSAQQHVREEFGPERKAQRLLQIYRRLSNRDD